MNKFAQLGADIAKLWLKYGNSYFGGIKNTLILALVGTVIGCLIGFICGILNTIPYSRNDNPVKRFFLALIRVIIRIYVEVFRGTPMVLQAVFLYYGLPYFTNNSVKFTSVWAAAIVVVSINTGDACADHDQCNSPAGTPEYYAADRKQFHYQCERHFRHVHYRVPRLLRRSPGSRWSKLSVFPVRDGRDGRVSDHDTGCIASAPMG